MSSEDNIIRKGPNKAKRVVLADQVVIEQYKQVAEDFMFKIFGLKPDKYLITDESSISDFKGVNQFPSVQAVEQRIEEVYGFAPHSPYLVDIFRHITI